jgi:outer membrane protein OmpA-like peptidoglycan-associated protein
MFSSAAPPAKKAPSDPFVFRDLADSPDTEYPSVAVVLWDKRENLDLRQAEKAHELAIEAGAEQYAPSQLRRSFTTLTQARNLAAVNKKKAAIDYSRRTVALSAEALYTTQRRKEAEALEAEIARRKAEMEALEQRARDAEETAAKASTALAEVERQRAETERQRLAAEAAVLAADQELQRLAQEKSALEQSMAELEERALTLRAEKEALSDRLQGALSQVAETRESARGMIVNLPDILFATNEAELKGEARVVIAKLAGILLIMDELNLRVEGHTDSTGSAEYNQGLSERRAASVRDFLAAQGIGMNRMVAVGYGLTRPVADNTTYEGRARNRRVEIIIAEGTVAEAGGP